MCGGDLNSKNVVWGGRIDDDRGTLLLEFFLASSLNVLNNSYSLPTFETQNGRSWIDLFVTSTSLVLQCRNWEVLEEPSLSDHRYIVFSIYGDIPLVLKTITASGRARIHEKIKQDEWFDRAMDDSARNPRIVNIALDVFYRKFSSWQHKESRTIKVNQRSNPWWNEDLGMKRKKANALRRRFQRCRNGMRNFYKDEYYLFLNQYQSDIKQAKLLSWRKFCGDAAKINILDSHINLLSINFVLR